MSRLLRAISDPNLTAGGRPSLGENWRKFVYRPLNKRTKEIRVLKLIPSLYFEEDPECELEVVELEPAEFVAVSYEWGDSRNQRWMILNGYRVKIGENAHTALRYFRQGGIDELLWLDAISINQLDIAERNHQVTLMRSIYTDAIGVLHWLGEQSRSDGYAFRILTDMANLVDKDMYQGLDGYEDRVQPATTFDNEAYQIILDFLDKTIWHRLWIVQEIALGSIGGDRSFLQCGRSRLPWWSFRQAIHWVYNALLKSWRTLLTPSQQAQNVFRRCSVLLTYIQRTDIQYDEISLLNSSLYVTDPRDRIYGLLPLFPNLNIQPRYELSVEDVYEEATFAFIRHHSSLDILTSCSFDSDASRLLPSWVADWRNKDENTLAAVKWTYLGNDSSVGRYDACARLPAFVALNDHELKVRGLSVFQIRDSTIFGPLLEVGPNVPEWNTIVLATEAALRFTLGLYDVGSLPRVKSNVQLMQEVGRTLLLDRYPAKTGDEAAGRVDHHAFDSSEAPVLRRLFPNHCTLDQKQDATAAQEWEDDWASEMRNRLYGTYFAISPEQQLCILPSGIEHGDLLYILAGLSIPVVLRQVQSRLRPTFRIVGLAYVHGIMDGEVIHASVIELSNGYFDAQSSALDDIWLA